MHFQQKILMVYILSVNLEIGDVKANMAKVEADIDKVTADIQKCMYLPRLFEAFMQVSFRGTFGS